MKKILFTLSIILEVNIIFADIAPNPIFINGVIPSSPCKIQMVSETVNASIYKDSSFVECVFLLKNYSGKTRLNVGFPIMSFYHWMPPENWDPASENFSVWVNNQMTIEFKRYIPEELLEKQKRLNYLDSLAMRDYLRVSDSLKALYPICSRKEEINFYEKFDSLFHHVRNPKALIELRKDIEYLVDYSQTPWFLWDMSFDSLESKTVTIKYRVPSGSGYWSSYQYFKYILSTGSGWYKSIEKADITVKIMDFNINKIDLTNPQNFIIDKREKEIRWKLRDIEPTNSDNIYVQYSFGKNKFNYWYHKKLRFYLFKYFSPKYYIQRHQENKRYKDKCKKNKQVDKEVGICHWLFCTAGTFCLKRTTKWSAVQPAPAPAWDSLLVSRPPDCRRQAGFLPLRELSNNHHKPASHHECKNTPTSLRSVRGTARHHPEDPGRQLHIPLTVMGNKCHQCKSSKERKLS